jgi:hypothetical protein
MPATPLAIDRLAKAVESMTDRTEAVLTRVEASIGRLETNQKLMLHEFAGLARRVAEHEVRITDLEIKVRATATAAKIVRKKKKQR